MYLHAQKLTARMWYVPLLLQKGPYTRQTVSSVMTASDARRPCCCVPCPSARQRLCIGPEMQLDTRQWGHILTNGVLDLTSRNDSQLHDMARARHTSRAFQTSSKDHSAQVGYTCLGRNRNEPNLTSYCQLIRHSRIPTKLSTLVQLFMIAFTDAIFAWDSINPQLSTWCGVICRVTFHRCVGLLDHDLHPIEQCVEYVEDFRSQCASGHNLTKSPT
ncbi:hypothetical protein AVEN_259345-1 [Araneus ventricosus]|uniref:Uncharacterized protein n=1 Tax=Araneus ventricosus TaxID=182803 RepID=A0A4Y2DTS7_ARAVE|nr:hypothetical protein AVEN_259345-1 [Araneus ventricosus]